MLRLGIVGCGRVTTMFHLKAVREVEEVAVVAVADRNRARMEKVKGEAGALRGYVDHRELLSDPEVEAVVINTPPRFHEEMAVDALRAGKHVLCEKPLAQSAEGCLRVKRVQEETGLVVLPGHNYAFTPSLERAEEVIRGGGVGEVRRVSVRFENNLRSYGARSDFRLKTEFGIVEDILPHILSVTSGVAGEAEEVREVDGWRERHDVVDNLNLLLRTGDGVSLDCSMSWTKLIPCFRVNIVGTSALIEMDLMRNPYSLSLESGGRRRRIGERRGLKLYWDLLRFKHPSFQRQYRHLHGLVEGAEAPRFTVDDEIGMVRMVEEVVRRLSETNLSKPQEYYPERSG
ncbi:MAG: Gfo/Idh/MocA family protein [Candidatus Bathyarchaeia archaeon]